ncbi:MAG: cytochrome c3 family protein [Acidobacteria bacterium]|nr:cytochrome c3 family protein [Acidobacteriota bacterium]MBI3488191.1 cytochrome c3 family protein [Acidobacteriota bacterium]
MRPFPTCTPSLLLAAFLTLPAPAQDSKGPALPPYHAKAGVHCFDCHQEEKPTKKASSESCMTCHGDYPAMKAVTKNVKPNPHGSHQGEIPCAECHRQHRPPVVKCLECHAGKYAFNIR